MHSLELTKLYTLWSNFHKTIGCIFKNVKRWDNFSSLGTLLPITVSNGILISLNHLSVCISRYNFKLYSQQQKEKKGIMAHVYVLR